MTEYTASNGGTIRVEVGGRTTVTDHTRERLSDTAETISRTAYLNAAQASTLREFFQHERDEELGRWRWPENPEWLAVEGERSPEGRTVVVVNERTLDRFWFNERVMTIPADASAAHKAGCAFFEAHPKRRPWVDATPGEVWVLTLPDPGDVDAEIVTVATTYGTFTAGSMSEWTLNDERIVTARRVPTEEAW